MLQIQLSNACAEAKSIKLGIFITEKWFLKNDFLKKLLISSTKDKNWSMFERKRVNPGESFF